MRKEIVCYIETNEEGEEVSVQRVTNDPMYVLLRVGTTRLVLNKSQLLDAVGTCDFYGTMFDEEKKQKENKVKLDASRDKARKLADTFSQGEVVAAPVKKSSKVKGLTKEEEGTIILDQEIRTAPTESELALKKLMEDL
jgi:hypothetical protein